MKHWVFDLDGTLVDSFAHYFASLDDIFRQHGSRFTAEMRHELITEPLVGVFAKHLGAAAVEPAMALLQTRSNADAAIIQPFTGIPDALANLEKRGTRMAVWTNRDLTSARIILERSGLGRYMETMVSGECVRRKPHADGLHRLAGHFGCTPAEITMVGDHDHDVFVAKDHGARAVRASWHGYWPHAGCPRADHQFHSVEDFAAWVSAGS